MTRAALDHSAPPLVVELNVVHLPYPVAEALAELPRVEGHGLGAVVGLVDPHQPVCQLKHVVTQRDDDELGVLCTLLGEYSILRNNNMVTTYFKSSEKKRQPKKKGGLKRDPPEKCILKPVSLFKYVTFLGDF